MKKGIVICKRLENEFGDVHVPFSHKNSYKTFLRLGEVQDR